ncbi:hypothetical protein GCM10023203_49770 [Actinomycetospora straminea]|uniref:Uncharacterized protein n=1 Tax=Actinomycetospora straminea TaxID=663607 RepID=A0ABP9EZP6_9PSEU
MTQVAAPGVQGLMDRPHQTGARGRTPYRVRPPARAHHRGPVTRPGVHLAGVGEGGGPAHARPRSRAVAAAARLAAALLVFVLALLLVTGLEVVMGEPLSGGRAGHTSLGDLLHPR